MDHYSLICVALCGSVVWLYHIDSECVLPTIYFAGTGPLLSNLCGVVWFDGVVVSYRFWMCSTYHILCWHWTITLLWMKIKQCCGENISFELMYVEICRFIFVVSAETESTVNDQVNEEFRKKYPKLASLHMLFAHFQTPIIVVVCCLWKQYFHIIMN